MDQNFLSDCCKVINAGTPRDINTTGLSGSYVKMSNYSHLTAIIQLGAVSASSTVMVKNASDQAGTGASALPFRYRKCEISAGENLDELKQALVDGFATSLNSNTFYAIELDAAELDADKPWVRVELSKPGKETMASLLYILSGTRYQGEILPSALI